MTNLKFNPTLVVEFKSEYLPIITIINIIYLNPKVRPSNYNIKIIGGLIFYEVHIWNQT